MRILRIGVIALALASLAIYFTACGGGSTRESASSDGDDYETDLIAGAGQGWPGTGYDAGDVTVTNNGGDITVAIELGDGYYFDEDDAENVHIYVGSDAPTTNAPGQLGFAEHVDGSSFSHTFTGMGEGTLYYAVHAVVCHMEEGQGEIQENGECTLGLVNADGDGHVVINLYQGNDNNDRGDVDLWIEDGDLYVKVTVVSCDLTETQMFIGAGTPPSAAGQWNFNSGPLDSVCEYTFGPIDLDDFEVACDDNCEPTVGSLNFALHTADAGQSSTAWGCNRVKFIQPNGKPHWKSWDSCVLSFVCDDGGGIIEVEECDTAWAFDNSENGGQGFDDDGDGVAKNEPGWKFGGTQNNWSWWFLF